MSSKGHTSNGGSRRRGGRGRCRGQGIILQGSRRGRQIKMEMRTVAKRSSGQKYRRGRPRMPVEGLGRLLLQGGKRWMRNCIAAEVYYRCSQPSSINGRCCRQASSRLNRRRLPHECWLSRRVAASGSTLLDGRRMTTQRLKLVRVYTPVMGSNVTNVRCSTK